MEQLEHQHQHHGAHTRQRLKHVREGYGTRRPPRLARPIVIVLPECPGEAVPRRQRALMSTLSRHVAAKYTLILILFEF